jgi:hypothetical protein
MKSLLVITATTLLLSSAAFASTVEQESNTNFATATYQTKAEAFDAGFDIVDNLKTMTNSELRNKLSLYGEDFVTDITINGSEVTVTELATSPGNIQYKALVNVDYNYTANENNDD